MLKNGDKLLSDTLRAVLMLEDVGRFKKTVFSLLHKACDILPVDMNGAVAGQNGNSLICAGERQQLCCNASCAVAIGTDERHTVFVRNIVDQTDHGYPGGLKRTQSLIAFAVRAGEEKDHPRIVFALKLRQTFRDLPGAVFCIYGGIMRISLYTLYCESEENS